MAFCLGHRGAAGGKKLMIVAHGNTLRALVKHLDGISEADITSLNIPTSVPLVYELDINLQPVKSGRSWAPLSGYYLGDQEEIKKAINGVQAQTAAAPAAAAAAPATESTLAPADPAPPAEDGVGAGAAGGGGLERGEGGGFMALPSVVSWTLH
jgi:hypothetical protein